MLKKKLGVVGWRSMVGAVLIQRMHFEGDFLKVNPHFFSSSQKGTEVIIANKAYILLDAYSLTDLLNMDIIITTQGSNYSNKIYQQLKDNCWNGYWIDAASAFRMNEDSCIVLDPINQAQIKQKITQGIKIFTGGNCSITLVLLGLAGLLKAGMVEWLSIMTYQAASGAGAQNVRELIKQNKYLSDNLNNGDHLPVIDLMQQVNQILNSQQLPITEFGTSLLGNTIPWIDTDLGNGNSREEWKGEVEANKILGLAPGTVKVDGLCVRVATIRSHMSAITMKLNYDLSVEQINDILTINQPWIKLVANDKNSTIKNLTPLSSCESLQIAVGRIKKLSLGDKLYSVITIGDQLLWGAAEPLRRVLNNILDYCNN